MSKTSFTRSRRALAFGIVMAGAVGLGWWATHRNPETKSGGPARVAAVDPATVAARIAEDRRKLDDAQTPDPQRIKSMYNLANSRDPKALETALRFVDKESRSRRMAGIHTLGYFDDERAVAKLEALLKDRDLNTRVSAITALGFRAGAKREALLKATVARKDLSEMERIQSLASLYRVSTAPETKTELIGKLVDAAKSVNSDESRNRVTGLLIGLAPKDERVIAYSKSTAESGKPAFSATLARRHLGAIQRQ